MNNSNLRDLSINLNITRILASIIPKGIIVILEFGIYTNQEVRDLRSMRMAF